MLRPGGRLLATFFLLDRASRAALRAGRTTIPFPTDDEEAEMAVADPDLPEEAVAFDERWVRARLDVRSVHPGAWRGERAGAVSYQDIVVACA